MKAILIMDMPSSCRGCHIMFTEDAFTNYCPCNRDDVTAYIRNDTKPDWCPLRPAPEKRQTTDDFWEMCADIVRNACIDEILGDKE